MRRALMVGAAGLALVAACSTTAAHNTPTTPPTTTNQGDDAAPRSSGLDLHVQTSRDRATVGFATGDIFSLMSADSINAYFANMQQLTGVHLARVDIKMSDVLPKLGATENWSIPDTVVKALAGHDMWLHAIFDSPAGWATNESCGANFWECGPDKNPQAYVDFAVAGAKRYCPVLRTAEVLNEPTKAYYGRPADYADLFAKVYAGIKQVCPNARVEPGGTQAVGTSSPQEGYRPSDWYEALCTTPGYTPVGQIASLHPYTWPSTPAVIDPSGQWAEVLFTNALLGPCGIKDPEIDISEFGFPTAGGDRPPTDERYPPWQDSQPVTAHNQALFLGDMFAQVQAMRDHGANIAEVIIYTFQDRNTGGTDVEDNFGVVDSKGQPKTDPQGRGGPTAVEVIKQAAGRT